MIQYLEIGKIIKCHGVKGEVKVFPLTDDPRRFDNLKSILVDLNKSSKGDMSLKEFHVQTVKYHKDFVLLKLDGIDDIDAAETLRNCFIKIHRSNAVKLPKNSYFICDIIGLKVTTVEGTELGTLTDVVYTGSNDVYIVTMNGKSICVPALKSVVKLIDIDNQIMQVDLPRGLTDEV